MWYLTVCNTYPEAVDEYNDYCTNCGFKHDELDIEEVYEEDGHFVGYGVVKKED